MRPATLFAASDTVVLDLLRQADTLTVSQLAQELQVTATAVRQRLTRLMGQGLVERRVVKAHRGRPSHHYTLTAEGWRKSGNNFHDLAVALWTELRAIEDPQVRRGLLQRIAQRMADQYASQVTGNTVEERMEALSAVYRERDIPFDVERKSSGDNQLPVLKALACPYPELAERDRSVCAMERLAFSELLDADLRLTQCRLDGGVCCTFE